MILNFSLKQKEKFFQEIAQMHVSIYFSTQTIDLINEWDALLQDAWAASFLAIGCNRSHLSSLFYWFLIDIIIWKIFFFHLNCIILVLVARDCFMYNDDP